MDIDKRVQARRRSDRRVTDDRQGENVNDLGDDSVWALARILSELSKSWKAPNKPISPALHQHRFCVNDVIQAVDMFFDQILDDDSMTLAAKRLIVALQLPVLRAATQNQSFLTDQKHPARRLIKAVFIRASDLNQDDFENEQCYKKIFTIIKNLENDFDSDERIFLKAYFDVCQIPE